MNDERKMSQQELIHLGFELGRAVGHMDQQRPNEAKVFGFWMQSMQDRLERLVPEGERVHYDLMLDAGRRACEFVKSYHEYRIQEDENARRRGPARNTHG